ncbi:hypothetical protein ACFX10_017763 [Malus domestica]
MNHRSSVLLSDQAVCTIVNTCFQVVQQSANRGDLLMRKIDFRDEHSSASTDTEDADADDGNMDSGYGIRWLRLETDQGSTVQTADEDVQLFALVLINSAIEVSGDGIGSYSKLLRMMKYASFTIWFTTARVQARLFNRLQLEAFFTFVLFRVSAPGVSIQLQEVALEGIINFCRQLTFVVEVYVNYDCDPLCHNVFEEIGKLLCKQSFPVASP